MKLKHPCAFTLLVLVIYVSPINTEKPLLNYLQQKYNIAKLVQDATTRISAEKDLKKLLSISNVSVQNEFEFFFNRTLNPLLIEFLKTKTSLKCMEDFLYIFQNLRNPSGWAPKMIDSYGKPESGIFQGNLKWLGDFDECINVYAPSKANSSHGDFHGKYCSATVNLYLRNMSVPLSLGTCLPDSCNPAVKSGPLSQVNFQIAEHLQEETKSVFQGTKLMCKSTSRTLTTEAIAVICLISLFVLLAVLGSSITAYEHFTNKLVIKDCAYASDCKDKISPVNDDYERQSLQDDEDDVLLIGTKTRNWALPTFVEKCKPFFNCFCVFTNGSKLLDTSSSEGQLPCLHGIRFLSLSWVIVCHTYAFCFNGIRNLAEMVTLVDNWPFQLILNGFFSVDSFFLLSGFLVAYLFFEQSSKNNGKIPWVYFYVHRYIRLTPVYMIVLAFDTTLFSYLGSGPNWVDYDTDPVCSKSWWRNILYINNFQPATDQCIAWSWYLANDMQFFVVSPIILVTLWRWPRIGYLISALFLSATFACNFVITYHFDLITGLGNVLSIANIQEFLAKWMDFFDYVYVRPYTRMSPYIIGISLAYYLYRRKHNNSRKNSLITLSTGWIISSTVTLACLFGEYHRDLSLIESCFYNALSRTGFALGLAWVIYVCLTGQGGFINSILSYKPFIPLSRLTYCAYLVHPIIIIGYFGSMKALINFSHITMVVLFLGFLLISYAVALATSLLFESPVIRLEKCVRSKFCRS